ncbi:unnamed protein product [Paramecium octaurelia]|uniref:Uncharacterized protein n=1 Tax=Paramecium octaurelia TaxID=43137 RepID=A0A8S1TIE3_PAROT|nr:unnamed protein product [Paramecium octaurelia]
MDLNKTIAMPFSYRLFHKKILHCMNIQSQSINF